MRNGTWEARYSELVGDLEAVLSSSPLRLLPRGVELLPAALEEGWPDIGSWAREVQVALHRLGLHCSQGHRPESASDVAVHAGRFANGVGKLAEQRQRFLLALRQPEHAYDVRTGQLVQVHLEAAVRLQGAVMALRDVELLPEPPPQPARGSRRVLEGRGGGVAWLTVAEAADHLNVTSATVREWLRSGRLEGSKTHAGRSGRWRIRPAALEQMRSEPPR